MSTVLNRTIGRLLVVTFTAIIMILNCDNAIAQPTPWIGQLALVPYNFAPQGWAFCEGQLLPINQNQALFSLLGTTYGGNGVTNFALPDLRGRVPMGVSPSHSIGESGGEETHLLSVNEMPAHSHLVYVDSTVGSSINPAFGLLAKNAAGIPQYGSSNTGLLDPSAVSSVGGNQVHNNMQPYLTLHWIIALQGVFPTPAQPPQTEK